MAEEESLVLIKPDALARGLAGAVLSRLEALRLELIGAKVVRVTQQLAQEHYRTIRDKPFFQETVDYLLGRFHNAPAVLAFVFRGPDAIDRIRQVAGATNPERADPMTIRGALGRITTNGIMENVLHASSDPKEAKREVTLWFRPQELLRPKAPSP
jgi:nucleoside-diphosphate kinase